MLDVHIVNRIFMLAYPPVRILLKCLGKSPVLNQMFPFTLSPTLRSPSAFSFLSPLALDPILGYHLASPCHSPAFSNTPHLETPPDLDPILFMSNV